MNNGNGGLNAPVTLDVTLQPASYDGLEAEVAVADFNGDGKLDIAALNNSGGITILYGNGDGTFQAPVNIALPSPGSLGYAGLVTADFDVNGTQDLAAMTTTGTLVLLFNDGKGNFTQQTVTIETPPSGVETTALTVGDFNADGRPDIAWAEENNATSATSYPVYVALNTANGVFSPKQEAGTLPASSYYLPHLKAADLDLDGKTDLVAWDSEISEDCCSSVPLMAFYSNGDGTFTPTTVVSTYAEDVGVTDINGDGNPDILTASYSGVGVYTGNGNRTFTDGGNYAELPGGAAQLGFGFFTSSNAIGFVAPNEDAYQENDPTDFYLVQNDNLQGSCAYPSSPGVTFCQATQNGDTATVRGTARAQTAPVRHIELWANGQKLYQVFADEFNATLNVAPGTQITAVEVEANGATRSTTVTPSTASCTAPSSPGVNVCSPTQGETTSSPVTVTAAGTGASGTVNHLELWIDGNKIGNYSGSTMSTSTPLTAGSHSLSVVEVDSAGAYVKSNPVSFTVGSNGGCAAPSSPGVNVCSPTQGETTSSPVTVIASGTGASGAVNHLELWVDGAKIGNYNGGNMNISLNLQPGSHQLSVVEVDSKGAYVKSNPVTFTVGSSNGCAAPSSPGVDVCQPTQGETTQSPVMVTATGTGASGAVDHLELWVDGNKIGNYSGSSMKTTVALGDGSHTLSVVEVDSKGSYVDSNPVTFTVGTNNGCAAPSSPGVNVCAPTQGETTSSPVSFLATGTGASGAVNHLELWIDGNKIGNYSGSSMATSVPLGSGSHAGTVVEVDSAGNYIKSNTVTFTVQ
jgi:hypothetical protein